MKYNPATRGTKGEIFYSNKSLYPTASLVHEISHIFPRFFVVATEVLIELLPVNQDEIIRAVEKLTPVIVNVSTVRLVRDSVFRTVPLGGMVPG